MLAPANVKYLSYFDDILKVVLTIFLSTHAKTVGHYSNSKNPRWREAHSVVLSLVSVIVLFVATFGVVCAVPKTILAGPKGGNGNHQTVHLWLALPKATTSNGKIPPS